MRDIFEIVVHVFIIGAIFTLAVTSYNLWEVQRELTISYLDFKAPGPRFTDIEGQALERRVTDLEKRIAFLDGFIESQKE